jgi:16S rRNA (uracil1498-N3)-methyltransferase
VIAAALQTGLRAIFTGSQTALALAMPAADPDWLRTPRLYVTHTLASGERVTLTGEQAHYLTHVRRARSGEGFRLFNATDGEWRCLIEEVGKRHTVLRCEECLRASVPPPDIEYLFAPLKSARLDYLAQKATELGVRRLRPVFTRRTIPARINVDRLRSNVIEAAEQCNLVWLPPVSAPQPLPDVLDTWEPERKLIYCDESTPVTSPLEAVRAVGSPPLALLIGPEGGFAPEERAMLRQLPFVTAISLGPRILRADTAAVAALAVVQSVVGDWK